MKNLLEVPTIVSMKNLLEVGDCFIYNEPTSEFYGEWRVIRVNERHRAKYSYSCIATRYANEYKPLIRDGVTANKIFSFIIDFLSIIKLPNYKKLIEHNLKRIK